MLGNSEVIPLMNPYQMVPKKFSHIFFQGQFLYLLHHPAQSPSSCAYVFNSVKKFL